MNNPFLRFFFLISILLNISIFAGAGMYYFVYRPTLENSGMGDHQDFIFKKLSLSSQQFTSMHDIAGAFHTDIENREHYIQTLNKQLLAQIISTESMNPEFEKLISRISAQQKEIQMIVVSHLFDVKQELNSKQQQQFFSLIRDAFEHKGGIN